MNAMSPLTSAFIHSSKRSSSSCSGVPVFVWAGVCERETAAKTRTATLTAIIMRFIVLSFSIEDTNSAELLFLQNDNV